MTNQNVEVEEKVVWVVMGNDGLSRPVANKSVLEIAEEINTAIENGYEILTLGNNDIEVDKVWAVVDYDTNKRIVIDEDNAPLSIPNMSVKELCDTVSNVLDWIRCAESKEEEWSLIELHNLLLDSIKDRYYELASSR